MKESILAVSFIFFLTSLFGGCNNTRSRDEYIAKYGKPDVISERAGDEKRYYEPGTNVAEWHNNISTFYYLNDGRKIVFQRGEAKTKPLTDDEITFLKDSFKSQ